MPNSKRTSDRRRTAPWARLVLATVAATAVAMTTAPVALLAAAPAPCPIQLRNVTPQTRITFRHTDGSSGRRYIVETVTAGLATFDYDGDGLIDIYFVNGAPLPGAKADPPAKDALYRNNGDWTFTDVTEQAGVGEMGFGLGVAAADYDEDGDQDLYVSNFGPKVLYRNNGDGTFTDVTRHAGVADGEKVGAGACFLDGDADGDLDLFVANYVQFTFANHAEVVVDGHPQYAGPKEYEPEQSTYFRNNGDGTFTDASRASGIADHPGTGMGIVALDFDNDADTDIAVLNDVAGNYLFANDGRGRFDEVGLLTGFAYNLDGNEMGSMGVDCGDYDNDGWLDLFQTAYSGELPALFRNTGDGAFDDVTRSSGAGVGAFPYVNWGTGFADFDSDGYRDLFIANGHLQDNVHLYDGTTAYEVRNQVLRNTGRGKFVDVSGQCGDGLLPKLSSRGAAIDDLDNDGDLDIVVLNSRRESTVIRNESPSGNHWLQVRLRAVRTNRDGVGARVTVVAGDLTLVDEVHSGRGYQGHFGTRLHFGLGSRDRIDRIEVRWIGGRTDVWGDIAADQLITLTERQ